MKNNTYQNAVDHLEFSDKLYEQVVQKANVERKTMSLAHIAAIAAVLTVLLATTALTVSAYIKEMNGKVEIPLPVQTLGTAGNSFEDAKIMEFTLSQDMQGVKLHYMQLDTDFGEGYFFDDDLLLDSNGHYYRITEDYQVEALQMRTSQAILQKGEWIYEFPGDFSYAATGNYVISNYLHGSLEIDENGEVLVHVYRIVDEPLLHTSDIAWPVYLNVQTGQIRDALPQLLPEDFPNERVYAREWRDGLLINVGIADEQVILYWIQEGATEPEVISVPREGTWLTMGDTLYYKDEKGNLYYLDESYQLQNASPYNTYAMPGSGLLEVMTDDAELGIYDLATGETYVFPEIEVNRGSFSDTNGYYTLRSRTGRIALVKGGVAFEPYRPILDQIGILDLETRQLKLLQIENGYTKLRCGWLNDDRFGVIYENDDRLYLCVYEFE